MLLLIAFVVGGLVYVIVSRRRRHLPLFCDATMLENIRAADVQKSLFQLERFRRFFSAIHENSFGGSEIGSVYQLHLPFSYAVILVSDYVLAKLILSGDSQRGIQEGEKSSTLKAVNFINRNVSNLATHKTANAERGRTRKFIAQAFSLSNLTRTWPHIKGVIDKQLTTLRELADKHEIWNVKEDIVLFFMQTLSRGAFGVEFTDDGTETENNVNGLEYLNAMDAAARESAREIILPLRKYMVWLDGVKQKTRAAAELRRVAEKILRIHASTQPPPGPESSDTEAKPHTILDFLAQHPYSSEMARLSDVTIFAFAGIDTTAYTFCFLLVELCKNPAVRTKLQAELATFMPTRGVNTSSFDPSATLQSEKELLSAIANCEYLTWCIKEILRLWPVAAGGSGRELVQDIHYNGMLLPKGSLVITHYYSMFRERWIDQPDVYLPERWSDSNPQLPQLKEMLMPFSLGKRACIGQNMAMFQLRIVAAHFLHYFDFELAAEPTFEYFLTLKPDQLLMYVKQR